MKTHTVKTKAWATQYCRITPQELLEGNRIDDLVFGNYDKSPSGWTFIGDAEITVTIPDERTLIDNKVEALREEAKAIRAEATAKVTQIESQIQNLLAISYDDQVQT